MYVYSDEVFDFIKGMEKEMKKFFDINNVFKVLTFEPKDERARLLFEGAEEKYLNSKEG